MPRRSPQQQTGVRRRRTAYGIYGIDGTGVAHRATHRSCRRRENRSARRGDRAPHRPGPSPWRELGGGERDSRKLIRLSHRTYVRVGPHKIGELAVRLPPDSKAAQILVTGAESHPWTWATGILDAIDGSRESSYRVAARTLSTAERADALGRSARRWRAVNQQLRSSTLLSAHPEIAAEFLTVTGRTGLTAADIAPAGDDKVRWRCRTCGHEAMAAWTSTAPARDRRARRAGTAPEAARRLAPDPGASLLTGTPSWCSSSSRT